jgi:hypothetical protein
MEPDIGGQGRRDGHVEGGKNKLRMAWREFKGVRESVNVLVYTGNVTVDPVS